MDDSFEKKFMEDINRSVNASQSVAASQPTAVPQPVEQKPIIPASITSASGPEKIKGKRSPILAIILMAGGIAIIVLTVALIVLNNKPSIASDPTENVVINKYGNVESIGISCELDDGTIYLDKSNDYFVELQDLEDSLVRTGDGTYKQLSSNYEAGHYIIDGNSIHFLPEEESDYYATYSSHQLTLNGKKYKCTNYD